MPSHLLGCADANNFPTLVAAIWQKKYLGDNGSVTLALLVTAAGDIKAETAGLSF